MISNVHLVYPFIPDPSGPPGFCGLVRTPCENCKDRKESNEKDSEDATYIQLAKEKKKEGPPVTMHYSPQMNKSKVRNLHVKPRSGGSSDTLTVRSTAGTSLQGTHFLNPLVFLCWYRVHT